MRYFLHMIRIEEIQERLRNAIKSGGTVQKEIAENLQINPSTVSKYIRLDKYPSLDTFANLCKIIDVPSDDILGLR